VTTGERSADLGLQGQARRADAPGDIVRITSPHIPLPAADALEDLAVPSVDRIVETVVKEQ
jgi:pyruvate/2-oxoglutarate/acetoin dehydrogenase E1 component